MIDDLAKAHAIGRMRVPPGLSPGDVAKSVKARLPEGYDVAVGSWCEPGRETPPVIASGGEGPALLGHVLVRPGDVYWPLWVFRRPKPPAGVTP